MEIIINEKELATAGAESPMAFVQVFINKYLETINGELNAESMSKLNGYQNSLLAFHYFREEVRSGGFVQLIHNGYGGYIFDNPFAKAMRTFGADKLSKLVYAAKKIYDERKEELEKEVEEEELSEIYIEFEEFDELDDAFIEMEDEQIGKIALFIDENIDEFATIKK